MNYQYIEQLVERYFNGETSLMEEQILRAFFSQSEQEVPEALRPYQPLFAALQVEDALGDAFDERILELTEGTERVKARRITFGERFRPLFRAAAVVAILLTLGNAFNSSLDPEDNAFGFWGATPQGSDKASAKEESDSLHFFSENYGVEPADTLKGDSIAKDI